MLQILKQLLRVCERETVHNLICLHMLTVLCFSIFFICYFDMEMP